MEDTKQNMPCGDNAGNEVRETMERCRKFGDVTDKDVVFDWWLASADGAGFLLFREPHHTDEDIEQSKRQLRRDRDVVGAIRVIRVGE